jgi:hypothetical protein
MKTPFRGTFEEGWKPPARVRVPLGVYIMKDLVTMRASSWVGLDIVEAYFEVPTIMRLVS